MHLSFPLLNREICRFLKVRFTFLLSLLGGQGGQWCLFTSALWGTFQPVAYYNNMFFVNACCCRTSVDCLTEKSLAGMRAVSHEHRLFLADLAVAIVREIMTQSSQAFTEIMFMRNPNA